MDLAKSLHENVWDEPFSFNPRNMATETKNEFLPGLSEVEIKYALRKSNNFHAFAEYIVGRGMNAEEACERWDAYCEHYNDEENRVTGN